MSDYFLDAYEQAIGGAPIESTTFPKPPRKIKLKPFVIPICCGECNCLVHIDSPYNLPERDICGYDGSMVVEKSELHISCPLKEFNKRFEKVRNE